MKQSRSHFFPIALLLLPFFDPGLLTQDGMPVWIDYIIKAFQLFSIATSFLLLKPVISHYRREVSPGFFILFLFLYLFFITLINNGSVVKCVSIFFQLFSVFIITSYYVLYKKDIVSFLEVFRVYFTILIILDIITLVFLPQEAWLFGGKNSHIHFTLLYLFFSISSSGYQRDIDLKQLFIPMVLAATLIVLENSTTAILALFFSFCFIFVFLMRSKRAIFKPIIGIKIVFFISFIISVVLIVFEQYKYLELVIAYFEKEETFGRIGIWEQALEYVRVNPVWGYGLESLKDIGEKFNFEFSQLHNKYVDVLYCGGIVGLTLFLYSLYKAFSAIKNYSKTQVLLSFIISSYAISFITEGTRLNLAFYYMLFLYPVISNNINRIDAIK